MKKVLVLGAGLVARPPVQYLMDLPDVEVTAASRTVSKAQAIVGNHPQGPGGGPQRGRRRGAGGS